MRMCASRVCVMCACTHMHVLQFKQDSPPLAMHAFTVYVHELMHEHKPLQLHRGNKKGQHDLFRMHVMFTLLL